MSDSNFGFLALALRQRLIKRWSLMHSVQPESVLEHSAVVTLLSYGWQYRHSAREVGGSGNHAGSCVVA